MKLIVAVDEKWGIGKNNDLLFSISADMKFFRQTTLNKVVVMGYKTLLSFPNSKPLKNRTNLVLSTKEPLREDCKIIRNFTELKNELINYNENDVYLIGGAKVYNQLLNYCSHALITKVFADGNAEVFIENLDALDNWIIESESEIFEENGLKFQFITYKNMNIKNL